MGLCWTFTVPLLGTSWSALGSLLDRYWGLCLLGLATTGLLLGLALTFTALLSDRSIDLCCAAVGQPLGLDDTSTGPLLAIYCTSVGCTLLFCWATTTPRAPLPIRNTTIRCHGTRFPLWPPQASPLAPRPLPAPQRKAPHLRRKTQASRKKCRCCTSTRHMMGLCYNPPHLYWV